MAHVAGILRRDPCQKCQLPVFLAERLTVGKKTFHRTCLKCARCGSQLTPGSFYETEVDDEYCCETCPDEEETAADDAVVILRSKQDITSAESANASVDTPHAPIIRSSIAERLAFFEQSKNHKIDVNGASISLDSKLLQKSVSDEEKRENIKRSSAAMVYKTNPALSNFLNDTIDGDEAEAAAAAAADVSEHSSTIDTSTDCQMDTADTEDELEEEAEEGAVVKVHKKSAEDVNFELVTTPDLPKTEAPLASNNMQATTSRRYTATAQVQLMTTPVVDEQPTESLKSLDADDNEHTTSSSKQFEHEETEEVKSVDNTNNNESPEKLELKTPPPRSLTQDTELGINLELSPYAVSAPVDPEMSILNESTQETLNAQSNTMTSRDVATTERLSVVRTRLQQFEVLKSAEEPLGVRHSYSNNSSNMDSITAIESPARQNLEVDIKIQVLEGAQSEAIENENEEVPLVMKDINNDKNLNAKILETKIENENRKYDDEVEAKETAVNVKTKNENLACLENEEDNVNIGDSNREPKVKIADEQTEAALDKNETVPVETSGNNDAKIGIQPMDAVVVNVELTNKLSTPKQKSPSAENVVTYPEDLNPFASDDDNNDDDDDDHNKENETAIVNKDIKVQPRNKTKSDQISTQNLNPFDSSDDEVELEKLQAKSPSSLSAKVPPPRPPPPRLSRNPFDDEDANTSVPDDLNFSRRSSLNTSFVKMKTPVPTPRTHLSQSQNPTPEPTPRLGNKLAIHPLHHSGEFNGSAYSLNNNNNNNNNSCSVTPQNLLRDSDIRSSNISISSSSGGGTMRSRKNRKAPAPPAPPPPASSSFAKELFPAGSPINAEISDHNNSSNSKASTPSSSTMGTPKLSRKKRPAPAPPKQATAAASARFDEFSMDNNNSKAPTIIMMSPSKNLHSYPLQSQSKLSDEEKALLEGKLLPSNSNHDEKVETAISRSTLRLIPLDASLMEDGITSAESDDRKHEQHQQQQQQKQQEKHQQQQQQRLEETNVVFRRKIMPTSIESPSHDGGHSLIDDLNARTYDRQLEKIKDNKEAQNRNRQSHLSISSSAEDSEPSNIMFNKSAHGKWKRRKGPAPALPVPPRKVLQMLPLQEIRHELEIIEVQQQGLEKQGVILENMIRERCEGQNGEPLGHLTTTTTTTTTAADTNGLSSDVNDSGGIKVTTKAVENVQNSKEVEDLILQLFELVNEKNELFRRQAELMYLRRQHRLEQEQADLEYEIRVLMAQPERNKTDTDKSREEALIARMVEVVQLRNDVIECLEMDRLREAEEDLSIKQRLELHNAGRESQGDARKTLTKLSKKEKKQQKELKKLSKNKKIDADKDADETELNVDKQKQLKKKKRKFLF